MNQKIKNILFESKNGKRKEEKTKIFYRNLSKIACRIKTHDSRETSLTEKRKNGKIYHMLKIKSGGISMKEKVLFKKICSIYADNLHFVTIIFPFIHKELKKDIQIRTFLETDEQENVEKILNHIGISDIEKEKVRKIDWKGTNIKKIKKIFKLMEQDILSKRKMDIIVQGKNLFVEKINKAMDLWMKNHLELLEKNQTEINIINCFSLGENQTKNSPIYTYDYILKTSGIEEIIRDEELLKAN